MARFIEELTEKIRARNIAKGLAKGREIGRAKGRTEWNAWNRRRLRAAARGESFNEPHPGSGEAEAHPGAEEDERHIERVGDRKMSEEPTQQPTPKVWSHNSGQAEF
ncbi:MAG: hypothetical protein F4X34_05715, partial [Chloroflexi bacterium]|nr:hypothetical protein [Chloroflexota bacterium]